MSAVDSVDARMELRMNYSTRGRAGDNSTHHFICVAGWNRYELGILNNSEQEIILLIFIN